MAVLCATMAGINLLILMGLAFLFNVVLHESVTNTVNRGSFAVKAY